MLNVQYYVNYPQGTTHGHKVCKITKTQKQTTPVCLADNLVSTNPRKCLLYCPDAEKFSNLFTRNSLTKLNKEKSVIDHVCSRDLTRRLVGATQVS